LARLAYSWIAAALMPPAKPGYPNTEAGVFQPVVGQSVQRPGVPVEREAKAAASKTNPGAEQA
jgi:hypothetical protein